MPKARGPDIDEALEGMDEDKGSYDDDSEFDDDFSADWYVDENGVVKVDKRDHDDTAECPCDEVDPAIWPLMTKWLRHAKKHVEPDGEDPEPLV